MQFRKKRPRRVPWQGISDRTFWYLTRVGWPLLAVMYFAVSWWQTSLGNAVVCSALAALLVGMIVGQHFLFKWLDKKIDPWLKKKGGP